MPKNKDLAALAVWLNDAYEKRMKQFPGNPRYIIMELMLEAKDTAKGKGIGGCLDRKLGMDLLYIDQGNPYAETIIYDGFMEKFIVGKWAELLDLYEMLHEHETARP